MKPSVNRRAFIAAGAVAVPTLAFARGINLSSGVALDSQFDDYMKQTRDHVKSLRNLMRGLQDEANRKEAAFLANQVSIMMSQCVEVADQAHMPERTEAKYEGNKDLYVNDLRIGLTKAATASVALTRALLEGDRAEATRQYDALREANRAGHDAFKEDD